VSGVRPRNEIYVEADHPRVRADDGADGQPGGLHVGALISIFFLMFRVMFMMLRYMLVLSVWMVQVTFVLCAALVPGGRRARMPRLRL
jgi:hypothetical protein